MKKSKLLWATLMSLLVVACLLSVPALSGENPWDADRSYGGGNGTPLDSEVKNVVLVDSRTELNAMTAAPISERVSGWISRATMRVSFFILNNFSHGTSKKVQINKAAN
jgi:hypothetical protein